MTGTVRNGSSWATRITENSAAASGRCDRGRKGTLPGGRPNPTSGFGRLSGFQILGHSRPPRLEPPTRFPIVRRRARVGAGKPKSWKEFLLGRPNRPPRPSPYRTENLESRLISLERPNAVNGLPASRPNFFRTGRRTGCSTAGACSSSRSLPDYEFATHRVGSAGHGFRWALRSAVQPSVRGQGWRVLQVWKFFDTVLARKVMFPDPSKDRAPGDSGGFDF